MNKIFYKFIYGSAALYEKLARYIIMHICIVNCITHTLPLCYTLLKLCIYRENKQKLFSNTHTVVLIMFCEALLVCCSLYTKYNSTSCVCVCEGVRRADSEKRSRALCLCKNRYLEHSQNHIECIFIYPSYVCIICLRKALR